MRMATMIQPASGNGRRSDALPIQVSAGILARGDRILICQRHRRDAYGLQWEFPGGKVENDETDADALRRELREELAIDAAIGHELFRLRHRYPDRFVEVGFFRVSAYRGLIRNRVFEAVAWVPRNKLPEYRFLDADRELVERLARGEVLG
jgi:8-oxo-dGTP diphosphatase